MKKKSFQLKEMQVKHGPAVASKKPSDKRARETMLLRGKETLEECRGDVENEASLLPPREPVSPTEKNVMGKR